MKKENCLIELVRGVTTLEGDIPIYQNAQIKIQNFDPEQIQPIAKYVLHEHIRRVSRIRDELLRKNLELFHLTDLTDHQLGVISPPVVEWSEADQAPVIVDGIHRVWLARFLGLTINTIYINNVDPKYPVFAQPVSWDEVKLCQQWPEIQSERRNLRAGFTSSNKYFRDLSCLGSTGRRALIYNPK